jgi:hypothetical protein
LTSFVAAAAAVAMVALVVVVVVVAAVDDEDDDLFLRIIANWAFRKDLAMADRTYAL